MLFYPYANSFSLLDYDTLFKNLEQVKAKQMELTRPRIVKKVETEDEFQIQIFKQYGDFNSYEMRAVRNPRNPNVVNIVIQSVTDDFKKVFQFFVDDIRLSDVDWEWYRTENVLVVRVPKNKAECFDSIELGFPGLFVNSYPLSCRHCSGKCADSADTVSRQEKNAEEAKERRVKALRAQKEAEIRARKEAEKRAKREAEEKSRREAEERARKEAEGRARKEAEERARKEAEIRQKEAVDARKRQNEDDEYEKAARQQQEFINMLLGSFLALPQHSSKQENRSTADKASRAATENKHDNYAPKSPKPPVSQPMQSSNIYSSPATVASDNESIMSEPETASQTSTTDENVNRVEKNSNVDNMNILHKHPSLEEVEDEEFTMFRKKFGQ